MASGSKVEGGDRPSSRSSSAETTNPSGPTTTAAPPATLAQVIRSLDSTLKSHMALLSRKIDDQALTATTTTKTHGRALRRESTRLNGLIENVSQQSRLVRREDKVKVYIRVVFLKVGEIDTIHDRFAAEVFIQSKWKEPAMNCKRIDPDEIDWHQYWNPRLYVENVYGEAKETVWYSLSFDHAGRATVYEKRRLNGAFFEYMELNQFPFDSQDLTVTVSTERDEAEMELMEDITEGCAINSHSFVDEQEWKLHKVVNTWKKTTVRTTQTAVYRHPGFSAACKASRRPGFFIWNIFVVMFFICSMSFATFTISTDLPQFRLQTSFILLLTTVTFKFVVNQSLPRISYLTYMDKYILTSMSILCCICVWHAVVNTVSANLDPTQAKIADKVALGVLGFVYIGFHSVFVLFIVFITKQQPRNVDTKQEDLEQVRQLSLTAEVPETADRRLSTATQINGLAVPSDGGGGRWRRSSRGSILVHHPIQNNGRTSLDVIDD